MCAELGVAAAPACIAGVWIVPLLSWYHATWDREPDVPGAMPVTKVDPMLAGVCRALLEHVDRFILSRPVGTHHIHLQLARCSSIDALPRR